MCWSTKSTFQIKGEEFFFSLRNQGEVCLQACIKQRTWVPKNQRPPKVSTVIGIQSESPLTKELLPHEQY